MKDKQYQCVLAWLRAGRESNQAKAAVVRPSRRGLRVLLAIIRKPKGA